MTLLQVSRVRAALILIFGCAVFLGASSASNANARRPASEPYFGHIGELCSVPNTTPDAGVTMPGVAEPSPPEPADARLIETFVEAASRQDRGALGRLVAAGSMSDEIVESCMSAIRRLSEECKIEPPYLLGDGEIRLAWVCGNRVPYDLFFTITDGLVSNLWSADTTKPIRVVRPPPGFVPPPGDS